MLVVRKDLGIAGLACAALGASAQPVTSLQLVDGSTTYLESNLAGPAESFAAGLADFSVGATDHLYQAGWWFRLGANPERALSNQTIGHVDGASARLEYRENEGLLGFVANYRLIQTATGALLRTVLTVTNNAPGSVEVSLFRYVDFEVGGTKEDDNATWQAPNRILMYDSAGAASLTVSTSGLAGYQIRPFPSTRFRLCDDAPDELDDAFDSFGEGDATAAFQWRAMLPPTESFTVWADQEVMVAPEPPVAAILAVGAGALARRRRR